MEKKLFQDPKSRARLALLSVIVVIAAAAVLTGRGGSLGNWLGQVTAKPPAAVTVAPVGLHNKPLEVALAGSVEGSNTALVTAEYSGRISEVYVKEGQAVKAGQPLVRIDGGGGTAAAAPVETAVPPVPDQPLQQQEQSEVERLSKLYQRYQDLYNQGALPRRKLEDVAAQLQAAQEALGGLSLETPSATSAPAAPGGAARQQGSANLTASVDGIVTGLSAAAGNSVQAGQQLMILDSGETVRVVAQLGQKELTFIRSGTPAAITAEAAPDQVLAGKVEGIFPGADPGNSLLFRGHIQVDNSSGILQSGMKVNIRLNTGILVPVQTVPAAAILQEEGNSYLFLALDGKAVRQPVTVGVALGDSVEITSGLPENGLVITGGAKGLKDGDVLTIQPI